MYDKASLIKCQNISELLAVLKSLDLFGCILTVLWVFEILEESLLVLVDWLHQLYVFFHILGYLGLLSTRAFLKESEELFFGDEPFLLFV